MNVIKASLSKNFPLKKYEERKEELEGLASDEISEKLDKEYSFGLKFGKNSGQTFLKHINFIDEENIEYDTLLLMVFKEFFKNKNIIIELKSIKSIHSFHESNYFLNGLKPLNEVLNKMKEPHTNKYPARIILFFEITLSEELKRKLGGDENIAAIKEEKERLIAKKKKLEIAIMGKSNKEKLFLTIISEL